MTVRMAVLFCQYSIVVVSFFVALSSAVSKNIVTNLFNLSISSKGIQNIKELYTNESEISKKLREALKETEGNWIVSGVKIKQIVIPIILITEKTSLQIKPLSYLDYQKNRQPINCILIPPIVINYYAPSH